MGPFAVFIRANIEFNLFKLGLDRPHGLTLGSKFLSLFLIMHFSLVFPPLFSPLIYIIYLFNYVLYTTYFLSLPLSSSFSSSLSFPHSLFFPRLIFHFIISLPLLTLLRSSIPSSNSSPSYYFFSLSHILLLQDFLNFPTKLQELFCKRSQLL